MNAGHAEQATHLLHDKAQGTSANR
jgi:hypothetical protein